MKEIKFSGRGGQGVVVASQMLGQALFRSGWYPQCYSIYGGERRGAPVVGFLRVDDHRVRLKCEIRHADELVCFEPSLLDPAELRTLMNPGGRILVASSRDATLPAGLEQWAVSRVDARRIAEEVGLGRMVNSAVLGAYCRFAQLPELDALLETIEQTVPARVEANLAAVRRGYAELEALN